MIPTLRVAHPRDPSTFMTINAADYREMVHGPLWHEQLPGFSGVPAPKPQSMDPAVRDLATAFMVDIMDMRQAEKGQPAFSSLSPAEQLAMLRADHNEMKEARERYHRLNQVSDSELAARKAKDEAARVASIQSEERAAVIEAQRAVVVPPGVVVGQSPGWPMDMDSGLPLVLPDEVRAKLIADANSPAAVAADTSQEAFERSAGQAATEQPAQGAAAPAWAAAPVPATPPATPPADDLDVSKGPGNKWYVMRGNSPVTEGFATKAEAVEAKGKVV